MGGPHHVQLDQLAKHFQVGDKVQDQVLLVDVRVEKREEEVPQSFGGTTVSCHPSHIRHFRGRT